MKTKSLFLATGLAAVWISPAQALEAPADDSPPPPAAAQNPTVLPQFKLPAAPAKPPAESAFLGVVSGEVPEMLADHLELKTGEGILVRSLVPQGPAATAGIVVNDVITKVGGQPVGSPQEITLQISHHKPGDKVALEVIHKGKPASLDVTLGARPAELAAADANPLDQLDLQGLPKELAERIRDSIAGNLGGLDLGDGAAQIPPRMEEAMRALQKQLLGKEAQLGLTQPGKLQLQGGAKVQMNDAQGSVEVKSADGAKEITIRDQQGNITWSGPWDTAQDKAAAPADVRQRVDSLNIDSSFNGNGLRLLPRQAAPAAPDDEN